MILDILCGISMFLLGICVLVTIAYIILIRESEDYEEAERHKEDR